MVGQEEARPQVFDFAADCHRIGPLKGCEGQVYGPLPSCAVEAKIYYGDTPDFSAVLNIENF